MPRFTATVNVHGQLFATPDPCKSSKDAQNTAARIAFEHFNSNPPPPSPSASPDVPPPQIQPLAVTADPPPLPLSPLPSSLPDPPLGLLTTKHNANTKPAKEELMQENCYDATECPIDYKIATSSEYKDVLHMYKNLLQQFAQKENLGFPVYTSEAEGPPHARRFKSKVSVNGKSYEALEFFPTLKEAEQAAAKIACLSLSVDAIQEDKALYKNLLQEFVQKKGLMCPSYETVTSGLSHKPIFVSTVEIGSASYQGGEAKTRKQAEMNAAKVAYYALTKGCPPTNPSTVSSVKSCHFADNSSQNIQPTATTEKLQAATCPESTLKLAGCPSMNPLMVSSIDRCSFSGNLSQNVQPTATTEKHQAATDEDGHQNAKRAKSVPDNVDVSAGLHANPPSDDSSMGGTTTTESVSSGQRGDNKLLSQWKTVVYPRKSNCPIPENATVMPYSDDRWVAYRVELDPKPTAQ